MPTLFVSMLSILSLSACASSPAAAPTNSPGTAAQAARGEVMTKPSPGNAISFDASQKEQFPLAPEEKKPLLAQFKKTLADQERALDRQQKTLAKEFSVAQAQQSKDWRGQEKKAREEYFDQHLSGPDRRSYVQSYIGRKKDFDQKQKDDLAAFRMAQKEKHDVFKNNEKNRLLQFQSALDHNIRPAGSLYKE